MALHNDLERSLLTVYSEDPDEKWNIVKDAISESVVRTQKSYTQKRNKPWLSKETVKIIGMMKELTSRGLNTPDQISRYTRLSSEIQLHCRRDKNRYYNEICAEIQKHADHINTREVFQKIKIQELGGI